MSSTTANSRSAMEFSQKVSDWRCMGDAGVGDGDAFSRGGPELPVNIITKWLKGRSPSLVVADFGCGDACLTKNVKNEVFSFDLVSNDPSVIACELRENQRENTHTAANVSQIQQQKRKQRYRERDCSVDSAMFSGFVNGMMGGVVGFREEFHLSELQESEKILGNEKICRVCGVFWVVYVKPLIFITTEPANGPMNL
ncbi:hypothetical protein QYF36_011470 [Acer negundo]|nr:hypothetical protein QYF36_011470 [Acer negundo]